MNLIRPVSLPGNNIVTFTDVKSHFVKIYFLMQSSQAGDCVEDVLRNASHILSTPIHTEKLCHLRTAKNGREQ